MVYKDGMRLLLNKIVLEMKGKDGEEKDSI